MLRVRLEKHPSQNSGESYYDILSDWNLIESSFLKQYGIRLRNSGEDDLSWQEFCSLLSGIMPDTPLGQIVSIRAEKDPKRIKEFNKEQKRIRNDWLKRRSKTDGKGKNADLLAMQESFKRMFS